MFLFIYRLSISLFIFSILIYILIVLREKFLLKKNIILIDNKHLTQEDIDNTDINEFIYKGVNVRSGDGIKIITKEKNTFDGIIIGANKSKRSVHLITHENEVIEFPIKNIKKIKIIDKYGSFLSN
ncbi:MAG TPA: hypothetical protein VK087_04995 [Tissierellaceae bacterium]|nr:hypothetical protein [Tissierellaceae bacterium]